MHRQIAPEMQTQTLPSKSSQSGRKCCCPPLRRRHWQKGVHIASSAILGLSHDASAPSQSNSFTWSGSFKLENKLLWQWKITQDSSIWSLHPMQMAFSSNSVSHWSNPLGQLNFMAGKDGSRTSGYEWMPGSKHSL